MPVQRVNCATHAPLEPLKWPLSPMGRPCCQGSSGRRNLWRRTTHRIARDIRALRRNSAATNGVARAARLLASAGGREPLQEPVGPFCGLRGSLWGASFAPCGDAAGLHGRLLAIYWASVWLHHMSKLWYADVASRRHDRLHIFIV